jgi:mannose-1-phosphate guanylyltransferase / mannose-6-phosphate isomerase
MTKTITPVILSGGAGTRLWPLSRTLLPKQLLPLCSTKTMLQETALRVDDTAFSAPLVICNESHRFLVAEQLRDADITARAIVLEPAGRNTAPAAAIAALMLLEDDPDSLMMLLPSDHIIADIKGFMDGIRVGVKAARDGALVTFGITPDRPETGYGYIRKGEKNAPGEGCFNVDRFVEKPTLEIAEGYIISGEYLWNSGMFLFSAAAYIAELDRTCPDMVAGVRAALLERSDDLDFTRINRPAFEAVDSQSIDYAVMEHTNRAVVVPLDIGWNDVGSWSALWEIGDKDSDGNVTNGNILATDTTGSYLHSDHPLVATIGLKDLVVVATEDAVLVCPMDRVQEINALVARLKAEGGTEQDAHVRVFRPWGWYQSIAGGPGFQVKKIHIKSQAKLSLQSHAKRAEHWVVVSGTVKITRGEDIFDLSANESTYIPVNTKHRLENTGNEPVMIIEIQSGDYLGEDDIIRYDDHYGRMNEF